MACEVMMNTQVEVAAMEGLYNHGTWNQPLSPELGSPVHAHSPLNTVRSPSASSSVSVHSPVLSHAGSPMPALPGCCSPVSAQSPNMQAAVHSPVMQQQQHGSPADRMLSGGAVKQEQLDAELRYSDSCDSLSTLLRNNEMIAAQNMAMLPPHMGPPHPRELLDGE